MNTIVIDGEVYVLPGPLSQARGLRVPDLLIAFDVDPEARARHNAYVTSEQDQQPDFVLEVGSPSTSRIDIWNKPGDYAALRACGHKESSDHGTGELSS